MPIKEVPPPEWHRGMPTFWLIGSGYLQLKDRKKAIGLFKGPMFDRDRCMKTGINIFGLDNFEIFPSYTLSIQRAKSEYKSKKLDKTCDISDSLQPIYSAKEDEE